MLLDRENDVIVPNLGAPKAHLVRSQIPTMSAWIQDMKRFLHFQVSSADEEVSRFTL